jgi:predicted transposase/invertase (TIGR01784 family)
MKEREETDWENYVNSRVTKATAKAVAKATAETKAETAGKLLDVGMDKKMISEVTGLSLEEIQKLDQHE